MLALTQLKTCEPQAPELSLSAEIRWSHKLDKFYCGYHSDFDPGFLHRAVRPHVGSFNEFVSKGLRDIVACSTSSSVLLPSGLRVSFGLTKISLARPQASPAECREAGLSYTSTCTMGIRVCFDGFDSVLSIRCGRLPLVVSSAPCVLAGLSRAELIGMREDEREAGGYFITNGSERIVRQLQVPRRHYPMALVRTAFLKRGSSFTTFAVAYRSVRADERSQTILVHALKDGSCVVRVLIAKKEFFMPLPLILRALVDTTDRDIYESILGEDSDYSFAIERIEAMLHDFHQYRLFRRDAVLRYLGQHMRSVLGLYDCEDLTDADVGEYFVRRCLFWQFGDAPPLEAGRAKFELLCLMARKLFFLAGGRILPENNDSLAFHEMLLPGTLLQMSLSEHVEDFLFGLRRALRLAASRKAFRLTQASVLEVIKRCSPERICRALHTLVATGNMISATGLDLQQQTGFSVAADRLNFVRFLSHFRSVHRGAFFTTMKTTAVRKLLPESFGFLCCVHTPDGAPCGLLNHLCADCFPVVEDCAPVDKEAVLTVLVGGGMTRTPTAASVPVLLDGVLVGHLGDAGASRLVYHMRALKATGRLYRYAELSLVPRANRDRMFPGLFVFTARNRLMRPVHSLLSAAGLQRFALKGSPADAGIRNVYNTEFIGTHEQVLLNIAIFEEDLRHRDAAEEVTHQERTPMAMMSIVASLVPFADHNQSPRNMYECQMLKQTMGFFARNYMYRADTKSYRMQTLQRAIVRNEIVHDRGGFDSHPTGTNLVVAVLSYTGYDMEDACLISKGSIERGLFHGTVYTTHEFDVRPQGKGVHASSESSHCYFTNYLPAPDDGGPAPGAPGALGTTGAPAGPFCETLDADGLPHVGTHITKGDPLVCYYNPVRRACRLERYEKGESGYVERVLIISEGPADPDEDGPADRLGARVGAASANDEEDSERDALGERGGRTARSRAGAPARRGAGADAGAGTGTSAASTPLIRRVRIILRHDRCPVIGDKFASRHGQKGVSSIRWPQRDMPFTQSGVVPDLIINPHAFPSRMTVGMLIESLAGKVAVESTGFVDSTPFQYSDNRRAVDYFGEQLLQTGKFNRYGSEVMYSGVLGTPLPCDVFVGVVYYQRLRHMITDKFQVRATGKNDEVTKQPVKGRKRGGGCRFGEMERDALAAHGAPAILRGRLCTDSDAVAHFVCAGCGTLLGLERRHAACRACGAEGAGRRVVVPNILLVLAQELASMGIRMAFSLEDYFK